MFPKVLSGGLSSWLSLTFLWRCVTLIQILMLKAGTAGHVDKGISPPAVLWLLKHIQQQFGAKSTLKCGLWHSYKGRHHSKFSTSLLFKGSLRLADLSWLNIARHDLEAYEACTFISSALPFSSSTFSSIFGPPERWIAIKSYCNKYPLP